MRRDLVRQQGLRAQGCGGAVEALRLGFEPDEIAIDEAGVEIAVTESRRAAQRGSESRHCCAGQ